MLAQEGHLPVLGCAVLGLAAAYVIHPLAALPFWAAAIATGYLFRAPRAEFTDLPLAIVSPVTGVVASVGGTHDPWFRRPALRLRIRVPFPGIGVVFSPVTGAVENFWTDLETPGPLAPPSAEEGPEHAWLDEVLESPTRYTLGLVTDGGDQVAYTVSSTRRHSRLKFDHAPGERAARSRRSGFVYFASHVDLLLPPDVRVEVKVGERVAGGSRILANLIRS